MNHAPLIYLGSLLAMAISWFSMIYVPQMQIGRTSQQDLDPGLYPGRRPGLAEEGLQVYRANGCAHCHSQQVGQTGYSFDLVLKDPGTNTTELAEVLMNTLEDSGPALVRHAVTNGYMVLSRDLDIHEVNLAVTRIKKAAADV